eukprot:m.437621 g.437621  ORF g.437621 m.437621 type:complete len:734 (-) comp18137_c0_seq1:1175-3376(-)
MAANPPETPDAVAAAHVPTVHGSSIRPLLQRLADKTYKKRRAAAIEVQHTVIEMIKASRVDGIPYAIDDAHTRLVGSTNTNARKGGLMALAAIAIALADSNVPGLLSQFTGRLLSIVLVSFSDPDAGVRYAASEGLYNIAKVARSLVLPYMSPIFEVLSRAIADTEVKAQEGAGLLDRLFKDIVSEMDADVSVEPFVELIADRMYVLDPQAREFLVSWVMVLQSVPGVTFVPYLPRLLDGIFGLFSGNDPKLQSMCEELLNEFLVEMAIEKDFDGEAMMPILIKYAKQEEHARQMALTWIAEIAGLDLTSIMTFAPRIAAVVLPALSASEDASRETSISINQAMKKFPFESHELRDVDNYEGHTLDADGAGPATPERPDSPTKFDLVAMLAVLAQQVKRGSAVTRLAVLRWILLLHQAMPIRLYQHNEELSLMLLRTACDPDDKVARLALECVAETASCPEGDVPAVQSSLAKRSLEDFLKRLLVTLGDPKKAMEGRMSFIVVNLANYLGPELLWTEIVRAELDESESSSVRLRDSRHESQQPKSKNDEHAAHAAHRISQVFLREPEFDSVRRMIRDMTTPEAQALFETTYKAWSPSPISTLSICLLAQEYEHACELIARLSDLEVTVQTGREVELLVEAIESPTFLHMRMHLTSAVHNAYLLKALYGLLMVLPQKEQFTVLRNRLKTLSDAALALNQRGTETKPQQRATINWDPLIGYFDLVQARKAASLTY